ncbi:hypothetical protein NicSoilB8_24210 [Arthrobacter sp. NicSoilB8]|nr:hypothetical protein NicSoilB8_24210 [Arthrobacter sp. NicSoilB8]
MEYQQGSFFPSGPGIDAHRHLRLAYGHVSAPQLEEAAARLARALSKQGARRPERNATARPASGAPRWRKMEGPADPGRGR